MRIFILAFACGTCLLQRQATLPDWISLAAIGAVSAVVLCLTQRRLRALWLALAGVGLGFAWAATLAHARMDERLAPELEGRDIVVTGVVASLPQPFERGLRFDFDIEQSSEAMPQRIALSWYNGVAEENFQAAPSLRAGERWRFTVRLKRPHGNANPHGFEYELWLLERGIGATGYVRPRTERTRLDAQVYRPAYLIERWRENLRAKFRRALPDAPYAGVLIALAIGDQRAIENADWQLYARTGVSHLMSISGLHVTMVSALFGWLVYTLWRRVPAWTLALPARKAAAVAAFGAAWAYCLLAGFAVPAQRTLYMVGIVALALYFDRLQSSSRVLCGALLLVLLIDPWAVSAPGFWLSFGAVSLMLYVGILDERVHWLKRWLRVQWAITLGLAPLLLLLFQQVSLVSPFANALAIPLVSFIVTPLSLLAALLPGDALAIAAHWIVAQLMQVLQWLAHLPGAVWQQHAPAWWTAVLAFVGIVWMLGPRGLPARYCGLFFLLPLYAVQPPVPPPHEAWIDVLDVGQGLAVLVRTHDHSLLYDSGPAYSPEADAGSRVLLPYLRAEGVNELDVLMISHADTDHAGGALSVLKGVPVAQLWSSLPGDHPVTQAAAVRLPCRPGAGWNWDGVQFDLLYPPLDERERKPNARSCVLRVSASTRILLTGDIEAADEAALLAAHADMHADVMLMPHHGSNTSSTADFIAAVSPAHAIAAAGYRNRFGHPRADVLARYGDTAIWRTDRDGAVRIRLGESVQIEAYRQRDARYWR